MLNTSVKQQQQNEAGEYQIIFSLQFQLENAQALITKVQIKCWNDTSDL